VADPKNKWDQPAAPPPPMFLGKKERNLVKQINDELSERVLGQTVAYYPVSMEESNFNTTYGEAIDKVTLPPIRVYAYVVVENEQTNQRYGYEYQTKLTVNFNRKRLVDDQNLFVRVLIIFLELTHTAPTLFKLRRLFREAGVQLYGNS